jgi:hypothetical protein
MASQQQPQQFADEVDPLAHVLPELHQAVLLGPVQQVQALGRVHRAGVAVPGQGRGRGVEGHADVLGRVAVAAHVLHLVTAVAGADGPVGGRADDLAGPLVIEHVHGVFGREHGLLHEDAAKLGFAVGKEGLDEVLFDVQILVEEFRQGLLVDVAARAHHGELEEPGHGRGQDVGRAAVLAFDVDEHGPPGQVVQDVPGLRQVHLPDFGRLFGREGPDGQQGDEFGFPFGKEDLQDLVQGLGRRGALGAAVQTVRQFGVTGSVREVRHCSSSVWPSISLSRPRIKGKVGRRGRRLLALAEPSYDAPTS